jgi:hypothetical protein
MTTKPSLQKILKGILHTDDESKPRHERMRISNPQEKNKQVIREYHTISYSHTNTYTTKQESPHISQY